MRLMLGVSVLALVGSTMLAAAADPRRMPPPPPPPPSHDWSGGYIGVEAGWGAADDVNGVVGGVYTGYDIKVTPDFVLGVSSSSLATSIEDSVTVGADTASLRLDAVSSLRARAGWSMGTWLPYVVGGGALALATAELTTGGATFTDRGWHTGWTVGAGVEKAFTDQLRGKVEYTYSSFGSANYFAVVPVEFDMHTAKAGVSYKMR